MNEEQFEMSEEQFYGWMNDNRTLEIFDKLGELKAYLSDRLTNGNTICPTASETALLTAKTVGNIQGLNQLLNISYLAKEKEDVTLTKENKQ